MKLSKLYCNQPGFQNIQFNLNGINVVYADVKTDIKEKKNQHDLGKTKIAELIDFLFLKKINKDHFLLKHEKEHFQNHVFYLEILLNSGQYLTIKRAAKNNTKISFAVNDASTNEFRPPFSWEFPDLTIEKARKQLAEYLSLDFFSNKSYDYRKALSYSLRTPPDDYSDVYQLSKFQGQHIFWKPFMFDLLGFDGTLLELKYQNDEQIKEINKFIDNLKREYSIRVDDRDDYVAQMQDIEKEVRDTEQQLDRFNFYEQDKELVKRGIEDIETSISQLNSTAYNLNYEIDRLRKSLKNKFAFDLNKVDKVFRESQILFPDQLKQDYANLIDFNNKLTIERNKLLKSSLGKKSSELSEINNQLQTLNKRKEELLSFIQDTDSFKKFKNHQKNLVKTEGQLFSIKEKINKIDTIIQKEENIKGLEEAIQGTVLQLKQLYGSTEKNMRYSEIRTKFSEYYKTIMDESAHLSWKINSSNNVDFVPPKVHSKLDEQKETAKDEGNTYKKLLCVAFDLAILTSYNSESYFRFVYHDDVLSQQDNGIKNRLIELIKTLTSQYDLQYVLSAIKADLPLDENDEIVYFDDKDVILRLHDRDESGTLFGFEF
ncbi:MAG: DUF2326 domain-containing protein [Bacteroidales bacterium]|nr:DUF2326 domain-containing protein [Bacteroidales bacterium]